MQWHGFSTAAGIPAHAQSINTPNFTFVQVYSPGVFTRAHLDTWGHHFLAPEARKDLHVQWHGFSTATAVPTHVYSLNTPTFTFAQSYNTLAYTHGKLETAGSFPAKNASLNV